MFKAQVFRYYLFLYTIQNSTPQVYYKIYSSKYKYMIEYRLYSVILKYVYTVINNKNMNDERLQLFSLLAIRIFCIMLLTKKIINNILNVTNILSKSY